MLLGDGYVYLGKTQDQIPTPYLVECVIMN